MFLPIGGGAKVKITKEMYSTIEVQYRQKVSSAMPSHFLYTIGLAAAINSGRNMSGKKKFTSLVAKQIPIKTKITKDSDHDGIVDTVDVCPTRPGLLGNKGCPVVMETEKKTYGQPVVSRKNIYNQQRLDSMSGLLNVLGRNILFENNSHDINPASYPSLDAIVHFLVENSSLQMIIEGHTDNIGSAKNNLILSERRARSIRDYLALKGVAESRISTKGYGESKPLNLNRSTKDRMLNRRVEFEVMNAKN